MKFEPNAKRPTVISGWNIMVSKMRLGDKVQVYIPSSHAYSFLGNGRDIKPWTVLFFDLELVNIYKPSKL